jgi:hypothetical protein
MIDSKTKAGKMSTEHRGIPEKYRGIQNRMGPYEKDKEKLKYWGNKTVTVPDYNPQNKYP